MSSTVGLCNCGNKTGLQFIGDKFVCGNCALEKSDGSCGVVLEENCIDSEVECQENTDGGPSAFGQFESNENQGGINSYCDGSGGFQIDTSNPVSSISLTEVLTTLGLHEEALVAVEQEADGTGVIEASVVHQRCLLLLKEECINEFIDNYKLLMMRHSKVLRSKNDVYLACGAKTRDSCDTEEETDKAVLQYGSSSIDLEEEYRLLRLAFGFLFSQGRLVEMERMCFSAMTSSLFRQKKEILQEIQFVAVQVCLAKGDFYYAYQLARDLLLSSKDNLSSNRVWNLFTQVIVREVDLRYKKFLGRLLLRYPHHKPLCILNGNAHLASGSYDKARVCKVEPENPLFLLLAAVAHIHLACQESSSNQHWNVEKAMALIDEYMLVRGECQETFYNFGRALHQLGRLEKAIYYYQRALACPPSITSGKNSTCFDLSREIAFNLSLIFRKADPEGLNVDLANFYIDKYITI